MDKVHRNCACKVHCADVDEPEDGPPPYPICKGLRRKPEEPLVKFFVVWNPRPPE